MPNAHSHIRAGWHPPLICLTVAASLAQLVVGLMLTRGYGQEVEIRQVFLEARAAEAQLHREPGWVRISREELEQTLAALRRQQQPAPLPQILQAEYQASWAGRALVGEARWQVWCPAVEKAASSTGLADGSSPRNPLLGSPVAGEAGVTWWRWQPFSLVLRLPVTVNGQQVLGGVAANGEVGILLLGGSATEKSRTQERSSGSSAPANASHRADWPERYCQVAFAWSARLETRGEEELASLEFPAAQLASFSLDVPASRRPALRDVETPPVQVTALADRPGWLRYSWALTPGQTRLELSLRRSTSEVGPAILQVQQQAEHLLVADRWQARYQLDFGTTPERPGRILITLPSGTQVQSVQERLRGLSAENWKQHISPQATVLEVDFPSARERRAELEILCRPQPLRPGAVVFPLAQVAGAASMTSRLTIRWSPEWSLQGWQFGNFQPQQPPQLVPENTWQLVLEQVQPPLLPTITFPRALVTRQTADLSVQGEFHCQLGVTESRLLAQLTWSVRSGSVFSFPVHLPEGWQIEDVQLLAGKEEEDWHLRQQGQRLVAELQKGTLKAPATVVMTLRLRAAQAQPDFSKRHDWPLPEVVPEQVSWGQATWYLWLERLRDESGRRRLAGVVLPGSSWPLRPGKPGDTDKPPVDYVFVGPLPSGARMRVEPLPPLYRTVVLTRLESPTSVHESPWPAGVHSSLLRTEDPASSQPPIAQSQAASVGQPTQHLRVRWSVQIEPVSGLVRSAQVRFPGDVPDLNWRVVSGDARLQKTQKRSVQEKIAVPVPHDERNNPQPAVVNWTLYEWTFDRPLLAPLRLEADWLFPRLAKGRHTAGGSAWQSGEPVADDQGDRSTRPEPATQLLWRVPLASGLSQQWWHGRISVSENFPPDWQLVALPVPCGPAAADSKGPRATTTAPANRSDVQTICPPSSYQEPAVVEVRLHEWPTAPPVLDGALLGVSWNGGQELVCDYYAWVHRAGHGVSAPVPESAAADPLRLRLPEGADFRLARVLRVSHGVAVSAPARSAGTVDETGLVTLPRFADSSVVYHVRYTLPASPLVCVSRLSLATPQWESPTLCLAQRTVLQLPANWTPLMRSNKLRYSSDTQPDLPTTLLDAAEEAKLAWQLWCNETVNDALSPERQLPSPDLSGSAAMWEILGSGSSAAGLHQWLLSLSDVWIEAERAQALSALMAGLVAILGAWGLRWATRWIVSGVIALTALAVLGLIWLPDELVPAALWLVVAGAFIGVLSLRRNSLSARSTMGQTSTADWFAAPGTFTSGVVLLAVGLAIVSKLPQVLAGNGNEVAVGPITEDKARPMVTLLHYREVDGEQVRDWVLVPQVWWQRWQEALRPRTTEPPCIITASRWQVEVAASPQEQRTSALRGSLNPSPGSDTAKLSGSGRAEEFAPARVIWELEIHQLRDEVQLSLPVSGVRWQQASEVYAAQTTPLELAPLDPAGGLQIRLRKPGKHLLTLIGQVEIQGSDQERRLVWKVPPMPMTQLRATFPAGISHADCPTARGQRRFSPKSPAPTKTGTTVPPTAGPDASQLVLEAELGPVAEVLLYWHTPTTSPPLWTLEEYHLLHIRAKEIRLQTVARYQITRGLAREIRWLIPDFCDVQTVEIRPTGNTSPVAIGWRIVLSPFGRVLVIEPARPIAGSWQVTLEFAVDPASASLGARWQAARLTAYALAPGIPLQLALAQSEAVPSRTDRWLALWLSLPRGWASADIPGKFPPADPATRRAWFTWLAEEGLAVEVVARAQATIAASPAELTSRWPIPLPTPANQGWLTLPGPVSPEVAKPGSVPPNHGALAPRDPVHSGRQFFQITGAQPRFRILAHPQPPKLLADSAVALGFDGLQVKVSVQAKLQASGGSLPVSAVCQLPTGFRVVQASGEQLAGWQQEGNILRLWWQNRLSNALVRIEGSLSASGDGERRRLALPSIRFPGFRQSRSVFEVTAGSGWQLQLTEATGLSVTAESPGKASYVASGSSYGGVVEFRPMAASLQVLITTTLTAEPLWWDTLVECRISAGSLRNVEVRVLPWEADPPLVISEEFTEMERVKEGSGYRIRLRFPDAASLFDQTVRLRLAGRPPRRENGDVILPVVAITDAATVRHRLTAWPRDAQIHGASFEKDAWRLPTDPLATPVTVGLPGSRTAAAQALHSEADCWRAPTGQIRLRLSCWLAHCPRCMLRLQLPTSSQLLEVRVNDAPVGWRPDNENGLYIPLISPRGFSQVQLVLQSPGEIAWPAIGMNPPTTREVWLRLPRAAAGRIRDREPVQAIPGGPTPTTPEASEQSDTTGSVIELVRARACLDWLERELPLAQDDSLPTLLAIAQAVDELLTRLERSPDWQRFESEIKSLRQRWIKGVESPRLALLRTSATASSPAAPSLVLTRPFVPDKLVWHRWSPEVLVSLPDETASWFTASLGAWLATMLLLLGLGLLGLLSRRIAVRRYARRLAPELVLLAALYWLAFLRPPWAAAVLALAAAGWRLRRWFRRPAFVPDDASFVVANPTSGN